MTFTIGAREYQTWKEAFSAWTMLGEEVYHRGVALSEDFRAIKTACGRYVHHAPIHTRDLPKIMTHRGCLVWRKTPVVIDSDLYVMDEETAMVEVLTDPTFFAWRIHQPENPRYGELMDVFRAFEEKIHGL